MIVWTPAYIGIGSNLSDPVAQVDAAFLALASVPQTRLVLRSPLYRTRPFGLVPQADYVNAVAGVLTGLTPHQLLSELRAIETAQGRERSVRWGPRTLDLDLLVQGQQRCEDEVLTLPHPGIAERNFVLYPLADIAKDLHIPGVGRVGQLAAQVSDQGISLL